MSHFHFDNSYARDLAGLYTACKPAPAPAPQLLFLNPQLALELGLDPAALSAEEAAALFSGNQLPEGAEPLAQVYAGHQFGGFSPQLGDGRALLLGEVINTLGQRCDIAFKGSGRTPYSRGGDGKAAVGPMLREVLIGEAMHALGIPTTRALAVVATGEQVYREGAFPGAVLTRVADSHLRVGTFQYFAARGELDKLRLLADYAIARHDPGLAGTPDCYLGLLRAVGQRQARLIAQWMNVGFIHGVMNTDNMTISGQTIDYGPCAFMEAYNPATVFSSIDKGGRYAYANQPPIARWNLARLAEALLPLMADGNDEDAVKQAVTQVTEIIDEFPSQYAAALLQGQRAKLGLWSVGDDVGADVGDTSLAADWLALLQAHQVDFTLAWRRLCDAADGDANPLRALFAQASAINPWLQRWRARCAQESDAGDVEREKSPSDANSSAVPGFITNANANANVNANPMAPATPIPKTARATRMRAVNPMIIARNHRVEEALAAASEHGDLSLFKRLLAALQQPGSEDPSLAHYAEPAPAQVTAGYQTYCGT